MMTTQQSDGGGGGGYYMPSGSDASWGLSSICAELDEEEFDQAGMKEVSAHTTHVVSRCHSLARHMDTLSHVTEICRERLCDLFD
jgi:hypothetical protein